MPPQCILGPHPNGGGDLKLGGPTAAVALAVIVAGCGSSEPSNASFASKANAICASFNAASAKLSGSGGVVAVTRDEALFSAALTKLEGLSAPFNLGAPYQAFLYEFVQAGPLLRQLAVATAARDEAKIRSIHSQLHALQASGHSSAVEAGLKACS